MDDFKKQGGHLSGREERTDAFAGEPRSVGGTLGGQGAHGTTSLTEKDGVRSGTHSSTHDHNNHGTGAVVGTGAAVGSTTSHGSHGSSTHKPSLMDKLNPKKDADGDGKAGFMK